MSAGKLSRFAGSVFVLAAVLGGIGAVTHGAGHETGGSSTTSVALVADGATQAALGQLSLEVVWG